MTAETVRVAVILIELGALGFLVTGATSWTALIPAFFGVALVVAAVLAGVPRLHRHAIHAALAVALAGVLVGAMNAVRIGDVVAGTAERPSAVILSTLMVVALLVYLAIGGYSCVRARRRRAQRQA